MSRQLEEGVDLDMGGEETRRTTWLPKGRDQVMIALRKRWKATREELHGQRKRGAMMASESCNNGRCRLSSLSWLATGEEG
jgi:hypothetical protein